MFSRAIPKTINENELKKKANDKPRKGVKIANKPGPTKAPKWNVVVFRAIADDRSLLGTV